jgi:hypothetical protein
MLPLSAVLRPAVDNMGVNLDLREQQCQQKDLHKPWRRFKLTFLDHPPASCYCLPRLRHLPPVCRSCRYPREHIEIYWQVEKHLACPFVVETL